MTAFTRGAVGVLLGIGAGYGFFLLALAVGHLVGLLAERLRDA